MISSAHLYFKVELEPRAQLKVCFVPVAVLVDTENQTIASPIGFHLLNCNVGLAQTMICLEHLQTPSECLVGFALQRLEDFAGLNL
jgi:hypothetical protein